MIRTAENLEDHLSECLAWRKIELSALKTEIGRRTNGTASESPIGRALTRGGITLLYAHWEGYAKDAFAGYLEFLTRRRLKINELSDELLISTLGALHRKIGSGDPAAAAQLTEAVRRPGETRARIPKTGIVNTKSNLRHETLSSILSALGLDPMQYASRSHLVDKSLCDARNEIAHGRTNFPSAEQFVSLHSNILEMMEGIRDQILIAVKTEAYRASIPPPKT